MPLFSGMPRSTLSAFRKAVASGLALTLAACQLQMPGTISRPGGKLATDQAAQQNAPVGPAANGTSKFGSATTPSSAKLDYNSTVVSKGPFGPSINPHSDTAKKYFLQQEAECPLPLPAPSASTSTTYVNNTTCQTTEKWRYYYKVIDGGLDANGNQVLGYYLMVHEDITSVCEDGISSSTSSPEDTHPDVQTYICVNAPSPSPSPSPTDPPTPTPAPPSPTPPAPTATPVPPPTPPPPPPTPSPPPSCDVSTDLKVGLQVVHAGFSPDGDGKEETADIDVTTCNNWNLTVKGPGLDAEKTLATGKGNGGIKAWNGRLPDGTQLNGQYTVTLKTDGGGPDHAVTVDITAYRFDQPTPNAFSPNNDTIKDTIPLMVHAAGGSGWTITTDDPKHPGARLTLKTGSGTTSDKDAAWGGTVQGNGIILPDGKYTLRVTPTGLQSSDSDPKTDVIIDTAKPKISVALTSQAWSSDGRSLIMAGTASIQDVGLAGLDRAPNLSKVTIIGDDVTSAPPATFSEDRSSASFTFTVTPPVRNSHLAYHLEALGTTDFQAGTVAVDVSAFDKAGNGAGKQHAYQFNYPSNENGKVSSGQIARGLPAPTTPLPPVQPVPPPALEPPPAGAGGLGLLRAGLVGFVVYLMQLGTDYDPASAPPGPPPPRNPNPKPNPGPSESPSPAPSATPGITWDVPEIHIGEHTSRQ